jgi:hypothetical protein
MLVRFKGWFPVLDTVEFWDALVDPIFCAANVRLGVTLRVKVGAGWPVPLSVVAWGLLVAFELVTIRLAGREPVAVGAKATDTVHELPAVSVEPQVLFVME